MRAGRAPQGRPGPGGTGQTGSARPASGGKVASLARQIAGPDRVGCAILDAGKRPQEFPTQVRTGVNLTSYAELAVRLVNTAFRATAILIRSAPLVLPHARQRSRTPIWRAVPAVDLEAMRALRDELAAVFTAAATGRDHGGHRPAQRAARPLPDPARSSSATTTSAGTSTWPSTGRRPTRYAAGAVDRPDPHGLPVRPGPAGHLLHRRLPAGLHRRQPEPLPAVLPRALRDPGERHHDPRRGQAHDGSASAPRRPAERIGHYPVRYIPVTPASRRCA